jgi:SNF2 family DNA or RNA helicase
VRFVVHRTPVQNNMREFFALLDCMFPGVFDPNPFERAFSATHADSSLLLSIDELLRPLMLRRVKKAVEQNLPPKTETSIILPLSPYQSFWYKRLLAQDTLVNALLSADKSPSAPSPSSTAGLAPEVKQLLAS